MVWRPSSMAVSIFGSSIRVKLRPMVPDRRDGGGAPPHVVEVRVDRTELVGGDRLELAEDEVVDDGGLLHLGEGHVEADLLPHLLDGLDDLDLQRVGDGDEVQRRGPVLGLVLR